MGKGSKVLGPSNEPYEVIKVKNGRYFFKKCNDNDVIFSLNVGVIKMMLDCKWITPIDREPA